MFFIPLVTKCTISEDLRHLKPTCEFLTILHSQVETVPPKLEAYWADKVTDGQGCTPNQVRKTTINMLDHAHIVRTANCDIIVVSELDELEDGLTKEQALGRCESLFDKLHIHEHMLIKVRMCIEPMCIRVCIYLAIFQTAMD
jgi:hypothetical protein